MGLLEQVNQMKKEGRTEQEIITNFQDQGIAPKSIRDALSQSQIKQAISQEETEVPSPEEDIYTPNPQMTPQTQEAYAPQQEFGVQGYEEQGYAPQGYDDQGQGYDQGGGLDTDTIIEISEQVFSEKIKDIQTQVETMQEFSTLATTKIKNIQDRLKRIETTIDKLQLSILDKVGSYGKDLESIKNEMSMIENSFSKVISKRK